MNKSKQQQSWTKTSLIVLISLFIIILIIPSLIVIPNNQSKPFAKPSHDTTKNEIKPVSKHNNDSPFDVTVYRSKQKTVETVPLEEYVVGVVASEMPVTFELEALKAQAIAARTYLIKEILSDSKLLGVPQNVNADISDNHNFYQVYKSRNELTKQWGENYKLNVEKIQNAVNTTKGQIITYDGEPIDPSFFSTSNGYTENSEDYWENAYPYLRSVTSPWDKESPKFHNEKVVAFEDVERTLGIQLDPTKNNIGEKKLTKSKRVDTIKLGNKEFRGPYVRKELGLSSSDFDVEQKDNNLIFTSRGYGHGVGMSQYGANGMAKEGKSYKDIVTYYYKEVEITNLDSFTELVMNNLYSSK